MIYIYTYDIYICHIYIYESDISNISKPHHTYHFIQGLGFYSKPPGRDVGGEQHASLSVTEGVGLSAALLLLPGDDEQLRYLPSGYPIISMGDLQDPKNGGTLVPYVWPYFLGIFPEI